ncbi:sn-glycerol-3-phosphate ABC transporter substrate-binding protein UgpB [Carnimonas bestiolae]|uniref:sn-glycerol-3-phosphate ABC transporter substrate-binding protein UgpB n=1 Tax=Carnimonas bestiolae TaxID=3402172 RepID=UPI003EDC6D01
MNAFLRKSVLCSALATVGLMASAQVLAVTQIEFWHSMSGALNDKVDQMADDFNHSQSEYRVKPVYRGDYATSMTGAIAAFRAHKAPSIVQIFEVGTATMMSAKGAIEPVHTLMQNANEPFDPNSYLPAITGYYSTPDNEMLSFPFNSSTPVLYANRTILDKAGVKKVPETWEELGDTLKKVVSSGAAKCGMTSTWPSWILLENFTARNDLPLATKANGLEGASARLAFNTPQVVKQFERLKAWSQDGRFSYGGRADQAMTKFYSGQCAMVAASSASIADIRENAKGNTFEVDTLPYSSDALAATGRKKPLNSIIGGASLWVMGGQSKEQQAAAAAFLHYLSAPKVQADWSEFSGYLPITQKADKLIKASGFYDKHPGTDTAINQLTGTKPTDNSRGLRLGNMAQIRDIIEEEMERIFNGEKSPKEALDNAVKRGDVLLARFEKTAR